MPENRKRILDMLSEGKITVDEAERLLSLVDEPTAASGGATYSSSTSGSAESRQSAPKYLRVVVEPIGENSGERVNVRVPMALIKAGMRFSAMMPPGVTNHVNSALSEHGINMDVSEIKTQDLEDLVDALADLEVDVEDGGQKVRVFVE